MTNIKASSNINETNEENNSIGQKFIKIELDLLKKWKDIDLYNKIQEQNKDYPPYVFLEGPPTANGLPHIGHALTRVIKDTYLRYHTMKKRFVTPRVGGWDCHGLPVEIEIEKKLGINSKEEIEKFGIEKFNKLCRESVLKYVNEWIVMSERLGFLLDMNVDKSPPNGAYVTMTNDYIESVWWSLSELHKKKLLFKGYKILPYCARCGTTLSSHELALGYKETKDPSIIIKFSIKNSERKLLAWTTTPWTLISNLLLVVKSNADYAVVEFDGEELILAEALVSTLVPKGKIIEKIKGKDLVGTEYESLFPFAEKVKGKKHFVTEGDFVTLDDGSGIVHAAPAFGEEDYQLCKKLGVSLYNPVDLGGKFIAEIKPYAGMFVKDADKNIIADLRANGKLFKKTTIEHTYPFCWRCDSPLLYYANESWFIGMSTLRSDLVDNNNQVYWKPEHLKKGRFGNFIDEAKDWSLSRSRYWGTPLPLWTCENKDCGHEFAIGSIQELGELCSLEKLPEPLDLHKPYIDDLPINCPKCKTNSKRESYVIDAWYDSGAAFFAQWHYPFENQKIFEDSFPVDFITEAIDQTRGWFYTLLAVSTSVFKKPSYLNCLTMGHILAEDGSKMSKSKGNAISPTEAFANFGADAVRFYLCNSPCWKSTRFGENLIRESVRNFQLLLWNIFSFFETYTMLDGWVYDSKSIISLENRPELDQYAISSLNNLILTVDRAFQNFEVHKGTQAIQSYLSNVLSNWWIRRSRRRFWDKTDKEHESAYQTLFEIIEIIILLLAPVTSFMSDYIYEKVILKSKKDFPISIHLLTFPTFDGKKINIILETNMNMIIDAVVSGRSIRTKANIKNRQPLVSATLVILNPELRNEAKKYKTILEEELNVKTIEIVNSAGDLQEFQLIPNFATIGPKFRKDAKKVMGFIDSLEQNKKEQIIAQIQNSSEDIIKIENYELTSTDFKIKISTHKGFEAQEFSEGLVFLNIDLSNISLIQEGISKDLIRRIQSMRKDLGLNYDSEIKLSINTDNKLLLDSISEFKHIIIAETLTKDFSILERNEVPKEGTLWDITTAKGEKISFHISIEE